MFLAFLRHMAYLAFVLSLTLSCYCAGLYLTWRRRHKFQKYKKSKKKRKHRKKDKKDKKEKKDKKDKSLPNNNDETTNIMNENITESMIDSMDDSSTINDSTEEETEIDSD